MRDLPILQELFTSDSIIFMLIGLVLALFIGIMIKEMKKIMTGLGMSCGLYVICELISNIHTNFMLELILLFVGTIAIGGIIGFLVSMAIVKARCRKLM